MKRKRKKFMTQLHAIVVKVSSFSCWTKGIKLATKFCIIELKQFLILKCDEASVLKQEKGNQTWPYLRAMQKNTLLSN
jgi:hypothetical protein